MQQHQQQQQAQWMVENGGPGGAIRLDKFAVTKYKSFCRRHNNDANFASVMSGPPHAPTFTCTLEPPITAGPTGPWRVEGRAANKKDSEIKAAMAVFNLLEMIGAYVVLRSLVFRRTHTHQPAPVSRQFSLSSNIISCPGTCQHSRFC
eukprot:TRINITY_DN21278_c0_g1_i1.p1 TRINITY_DN21278_c0_g1~~TRINITY_DN21278_c0_g1_i1.p1  ORF type:complete len:148 (+),score=15.96 TRINITY_DN21278_c0_g1_i1:90-533(+)